MKKNVNKVPDVSAGTIIQITERTCSDKIQPKITKGRMFVVVKSLVLRSGTKAIEVTTPVDKRVMRINAERFKWRVVSAEEIRELKHKQMVQTDGRMKNAMLKQHFSDNEIDHILFTPYIYELLTWHYVELCHRTAAEDGLDFRKVCREAKEQREKMDEEAVFELGKPVYNGFVRGVKVMIEDLSAELTRIWWQVNGEIKRAFPDAKDINLKTYAICGMLALRLLDEREDNSDNLINTRLRGSLKYEHKARRSPILYRLLSAYAAEAADIDYNRLELSSRVIKNNIECIKFTTLHNDFRRNY